MKSQSIVNLTRALAIPFALTILLVSFSFLVGWNIVTMVIFWFVLIPMVSHLIPRKIFKNTNPFKESIIGMAIFYVLMTFMIYKQFQTDYFQLMMVSFVVNILVILFIKLESKVNREFAE